MIRGLFRLAMGGLMAGAIAVSASAEDKMVELKFSHWVPPTHPIQPDGMEPWARSIEEASGGSIKVTIYPAQQLGKAPDHYDMARDGIAEITFISPGYQPGRFPIIDAGALPFIFANATTGSAALDEWYRPYAAKEMSDVKFCLAHLHDPGTFHAKIAITRPEQIKDMKIRPAHATMARFVSQLGGSSVQVPAPEAREALERGVADAITFPWNSIPLFGIDKVVKFHTDMKLYATPFVWVMNKAAYDKMSDAQKKVIDEHCTAEWAQKVATPWGDWEAAGREKIAGMEGHTIVPVTDDDVAAWRKAAEPLRAQWIEAVGKKGVDGNKALDDLVAAAKAHNAAY